MTKIPVAMPDLSANEEKYAGEAIRSTWISFTSGFTQRFEVEFARLCATTTAIGVYNGTFPLHEVLLALDVRPNDEGLVPSLYLYHLGQTPCPSNIQQSNKLRDLRTPKKIPFDFMESGDRFIALARTKQREEHIAYEKNK